MVNNKILNFARILFPALTGAILISIIIYKAYSLPVTHDEMFTYRLTPNSAWEIMKGPPPFWPNNHILNTLAIKLSNQVLGVSPIVCRIPNILSFILYFSFIWLIAWRYFKQSLLYFAVFIALLCNPYLLDFFGLARGYAMSISLMIASAYFLLRFVESPRFLFFWLSLLLSMLAAYANFTILIFLAAINLLLLLKLFFLLISKQAERKNFFVNIALMLLANGGFIALCYTPIHRMQETNQFVFWSSNGFYIDTVQSLVTDSKYDVNYFSLSPNVFSIATVALFVLVLLFVVQRIIIKRFKISSDVWIFSFFALFFTFLINQAQTNLLHVPNLNGRIALFFYPLFVLPMLLTLREMNYKYSFAGNAAALFIVFIGIYHESKALDIKSVYEWEYDRNTYEVLNYMENYRKEHSIDNNISLNTSWWFNPSFSFYTETGKVKWIDLLPYHHEIDTTSNTLFYYCIQDDYPTLQKEYDKVMEFQGGARLLLVHK